MPPAAHREGNLGAGPVIAAFDTWVMLAGAENESSELFSAPTMVLPLLAIALRARSIDDRLSSQIAFR
jgi:hypothetical protein